jgi:FimV-like protein
MIHYFQQLIEFAQHNSIMFASIVIISFVAIFILTILLLNPKKVTQLAPAAEHHSQITTQDISAIAGDDVCVTQLDLARAYIELGKIASAKQILESVLLEGDHNQQQTAKELLLTL